MQLSKKQFENQKKSERFDFIDGYRGSLVLIVLIIHCKINENCELVNLTLGYSQSYSIAGFFMLSAFLLTYRLLNDFYKAEKFQEFIIELVKYIIRRFFRIYVFYVLFFTIFKYFLPFIPAIHSDVFQTNYFDFLTLKYPGMSHLWTIPSEIKYYSFIPVYCLIARILGRRLSYLFLSASLFFTIWDQYFNIFNLKAEDTNLTSKVSSEVKSHFAVFIIGSETALAFFLIENNKSLMFILKSKWAQFFLNYSSLIIALIGIKLHAFVYYDSFAFKSKAAIFWSISLLMSLLCDTNIIKEFFFKFKFMQNFGKYGFSCYLLQMIVINYLKKLKIYSYQYELILLNIFFSYYLSMISFYLIENNLIKIADYLCRKIESSYIY